MALGLWGELIPKDITGMGTEAQERWHYWVNRRK